jgi:hypothetical protein
VQALLMTDAAIDGDQYDKFVRHAIKQFAVLQVGPSKIDDTCNLVTFDRRRQTPWDTVVE